MPPSAFRLLDQFDSPLGRFDHWQHGSGAQVLHRTNAEGAFGFAIGLPTPAMDDSGLTHVLEHMVFRGSRLHGDNDLYSAIRAGSLAFHLNASTGPDWTSYHCATSSAADALRIERALMDAVFHPLLRATAFTTEAFDAATGTAGVVHSEMTAHLATLEARLDHALRQNLFPNLPTGRCYGGLPSQIQHLSWSDLRAYHHRFYQPSAAFIFMTGADHNGQRRAALEPYLSGQSQPPLRRQGTGRIASGHLDGHSYWGLVFPPHLSQPQKQLSAEILLRKARGSLSAPLSPRSGFVDGAEPYLALYWPSMQPLPVETWDFTLDAPLIEASIKALQSRFGDEEADFRLPPELQLWPSLAAAHLRHEDLRQALCPADLRAEAIPQLLRDVLQGAENGAAPLASQMTLSLPPRANEEAKGFFTPLPLSELEPPAAQPKPEIVDGVLLVPHRAGAALSLCLWFDASDLPAAHLQMLPALAASAAFALDAKASYHNDSRVGLLIEARLDPADLVPWLARCERWFDAPPSCQRGMGMRPHLAAEAHLRGQFSQNWQQVSQLSGLLTPSPTPTPNELRLLAQKLRPHGAVATTSKDACPPLLPWVGSSSPRGKAPPPPSPGLQVFNSPLLWLGQSTQLQDVNQSHLLVAMKAIETDYLWPRLRVAMGAYSVRATLQDGILTLSSLSDPSGLASLEVIAGAGLWLRDNHQDPQLLTKAKLAALGQYRRPKPTAQHLREALAGSPDPFEDQALQITSPEDMRHIAEALHRASDRSAQLALVPSDPI